MLTEKNGILNKTTTAKEKTEEATAEERVRLEVAGSFGDDGKLDIDEINDNLRNNVDGLTFNGKAITEKGVADENRIESLPSTVQLDGYNVMIKEDGSIIITEWLQTGYELTNGEVTVKIGDYILNYNELSNGTQNATIEITESGYTTQQILSTEDLGWRILGIGENGGLELISDNPTTAKITLSGEIGYLNGVEILNNTCNQLYGKGQYAESARSINAEDINELANYDPETYSGYGDLWKYRFPIDGEKIQYSKSTDNGKTWSEWKDTNNSTTFRIPGSSEVINKTNPKESKKLENTYYYYNISSQMINNSNLANIITKGTGNNNKSYFLANRSISCNDRTAGFYMRVLTLGGIYSNVLFNSDNSSRDLSVSVRPVVSLKSNIKLESNSESEWIIK